MAQPLTGAGAAPCDRREPAVSDRAAALSGAPLDLMKAIAVFAMVAESANYILFDNAFALPWYVDRLTFPVFCFALAAHVARGFDHRGQAATLLALACIAQPFHALAFPGYGGANVLATLAIGAATAGALASRPLWQSDAALALVCFLAAAFPPAMAVGWEYGMIGALLPLAFVLALRCGGLRLAWPAALLTVMYLTTDFARPETMRLPGLDVAFAVGGFLLALLAGRAVIGRPRFLHRYALHIVYPGHLAALVGLRLLTQG